MPDYGEIFCEAVEEIVRDQLRGLNYDLTQVCQVDNIDERDKGIYWVSTDAARFKAYSLVQNYEVGDTVYVTTPNNDATQQKIIIGKKIIGSQQDITYVMPFNNIKDVTGNIVSGSKEIGRLANSNFTGHDTLIWDSDNFETGFTRLGLQGSFRSQVGDAVEGSYGLKLVLGVKGTTDEVKEVATFYLDADDMYGNPYNFDGYYPQQKVFDISALAGFDVIRLYFYQDKDFKDRDGNLINSVDSFGNPLKSNLFVNDLYICLGYDVKDVYSDGLILYSNDSIYYDETARTKTISWRFIQSLKDKKIKLITDADKLPGDYEVWLFKYNPSAPYDIVAGAGWERVIYNENPLVNFQNYQFTTDKTQQSIKYKAMIIYNSRVIYESNELEFINTIDVVAEKINKLMNDFYIYPSDEMNGEYYIYDNGLTSSSQANKNRYLYPAFKNDDNEMEIIQGVQRVKWIVPMKNTMIDLVIPNNQTPVSVSFNFPNEQYNSLEEYLKDYWEKASSLDIIPNYYFYKNSCYIYFFNPTNSYGNDQRITYNIKQNFNTNYINNTIKCEVEHNNQTVESSIDLSFGEKQSADYKVEVKFEGEEEGFSITDWDDKTGLGIKKEISARLFSPNGFEIEDCKISWSWYNPEEGDFNKEGEYYNPFSIFNIDGIQEKIQLAFREKLNKVVPHYSILQAAITYNGYTYYGYLPIPLEGEQAIEVEGVIEEIQQNVDYPDEVVGRVRRTGEKLVSNIISTYGEDDPYKPNINADEQLTTPSASINDLKAMYCYVFGEPENYQKAIPAFNHIRNQQKSIKDQIELPVETPATDITSYSLRAAAVSEYDNNKNYILNSDLSSGRLVKSEKGSVYNGVVIGEVKRLEKLEPKYGMYGFQGNKVTFAIDEDGDAYFGGKLEGATGEFSGNLKATEGNIGQWQINEQGLFYEIEESGLSVAIKPKGVTVTNSDGTTTIVPGIVLGEATLYAGEGGSFKITGTDVNEAIVTLTATQEDQADVDVQMQLEINKLDDAVNKLNEEIFVNDTIDPQWQEIEFISNITFNNKKLTVNKQKIKVLVTSDGIYGESTEEFNIE